MSSQLWFQCAFLHHLALITDILEVTDEVTQYYMSKSSEVFAMLSFAEPLHGNGCLGYSER